MKKSLVLLLVFLFALSTLVGCGKDNNENDSEPTSTVAPTKEAEISSTPVVTEVVNNGNDAETIGTGDVTPTEGSEVTPEPETTPEADPEITPAIEVTPVEYEPGTIMGLIGQISSENYDAEPAKYSLSEYYASRELFSEIEDYGCFFEADFANEKKPVYVKDFYEFINAIEPNALIVLLPGNYNISDGIKEILETVDVKTFNESHGYIAINEVYDGYELGIYNCANLTIVGGSSDKSDVQIITDPRYAVVLGFNDCVGVTINNVTAGHSERGDCSGNVLDFNGCSNVNLANVDLYGCGVYGIGWYDYSTIGGLYVLDSIIRDCSNGPFDIEANLGNFVFVNTVFDGSSYGGSYTYGDDCGMTFSKCHFGSGESNEWYFRDDAYIVDCTFSEITQYPEYPDYEEEYFWDIAKIPVKFDEEVLTEGKWYSYILYNKVDDYYEYSPFYYYDTEEYADIDFEINADKTGHMTGFVYPEEGDFTWAMDGEYSATLYYDERELGVSLYILDDGNEEDSDIYMMVSDESFNVWFYRY